VPWKYNNKIIREGRAWTDNDGIQHPSNWNIWSDADKTAAGMVWENPPASYDNRFWWDADTPKNIEDVNEVDGKISQRKEQQGCFLSQIGI
jgi:hypothetical protein